MSCYQVLKPGLTIKVRGKLLYYCVLITVYLTIICLLTAICIGVVIVTECVIELI